MLPFTTRTVPGPSPRRAPGLAIGFISTEAADAAIKQPLVVSSGRRSRGAYCRLPRTDVAEDYPLTTSTSEPLMSPYARSAFAAAVADAVRDADSARKLHANGSERDAPKRRSSPRSEHRRTLAFVGGGRQTVQFTRVIARGGAGLGFKPFVYLTARHGRQGLTRDRRRSWTMTGDLPFNDQNGRPRTPMANTTGRSPSGARSPIAEPRDVPVAEAAVY